MRTLRRRPPAKIHTLSLAGTMGGVTEPAAEMTGPKEGVANIAYKDDVEGEAHRVVTP